MGHIINDRDFYSSALKYLKLINWNSPSRSKSSSLTVFRPSKYHTKVFNDACELCGAPAEAIHHINPKKLCTADLNLRSNLLPVVSNCHLDIHRNKISTLGWKRTAAHNTIYWVYLNESLDSGTEQSLGSIGKEERYEITRERL